MAGEKVISADHRFDTATVSLGQALSLRGLADRSGRIRAFRQNNFRTGKLAHAGSPGVRRIVGKDRNSPLLALGKLTSRVYP